MTLVPPQTFRKTEGIHRTGLAASRPAAADVLIGTLYFSTDTGGLDRSDGTTWATYAPGGLWTDIAFSAANFVGTGGLTWTVAAGNVTTLAYSLVNKTMTIAWVIANTTLTGTPSNAINIVLPGVVTARTLLSAALVVKNAGAFANGYVVCVAGQNYLQLSPVAAVSFALDTAFAVYGQITVEVQ